MKWIIGNCTMWLWIKLCYAQALAVSEFMLWQVPNFCIKHQNFGRIWGDGFLFGTKTALCKPEGDKSRSLGHPFTDEAECAEAVWPTLYVAAPTAEITLVFVWRREWYLQNGARCFNLMSWTIGMSTVRIILFLALNISSSLEIMLSEGI